MANRETSWLEGRKEVERSELFYPRDHPYPDGEGEGGAVPGTTVDLSISSSDKANVSPCWNVPTL